MIEARKTEKEKSAKRRRAGRELNRNPLNNKEKTHKTQKKTHTQKQTNNNHNKSGGVGRRVVEPNKM